MAEFVQWRAKQSAEKVQKGRAEEKTDKVDRQTGKTGRARYKEIPLGESLISKRHLLSMRFAAILHSPLL